MKKLAILLLAVTIAFSSQAQVMVGATAGNPGPVFYTTLKGAFDAINAGTFQGDITIILTAGTTETASAVLYGSGTGSASYGFINIYPSTSGITISGNINGPLIDFNGADYVTLDGCINGDGSSRDVTLVNTSTAVTAGTSTIRFINDAQYNTVQSCVIKGSTMDPAGGVIFFSTTNAAQGNIVNTITNNNITCAADASRPLNAIYSAGTSGKENRASNITSNNFFNFLNRGTASNGIYMGNYNNSWFISGNSFYETASFVPTASVAHNLINVNYTSGYGFSISSNYFGGRDASCGGLAWTKTGAFDNTFNAIYLSTGTASASNIQGNTIKNFNYTNSAASVFTAINVNAGKVNIGTTTGNIIGASSGNSSITYTGGAANAVFYGIYNNSTSIVDIQNNQIGAITTANSSSAASTHLYGFANNGAGTISVINNLFGSTDAGTSNSLDASCAATGNWQKCMGVYQLSNTGVLNVSGNTVSKLRNQATGNLNHSVIGMYFSSGTCTVTGNTIHDLISMDANTNATNNASVIGLVDVSATAAAQSITGNTIYNLSNANTSAVAVTVIGIYYSGATIASAVARNFVHSLTVDAANTSASIYGIKIGSGLCIYSNNILVLGGNTSSVLYGIYETGASSNNNGLYYNTVYISGSPVSGSQNSYALYSAVTTNTRDFRNNIFANERSNNGATGVHYAMYIVSTGGTLICNNNDYYVSGSGGTLGYYGSAKTALPIVTGVTGNDVVSKAVIPGFSGAGGTVASGYIPSDVTLTGSASGGISIDYTGGSRTYYSMGAYDYSVTVILTVTATTGVATANYTTLKEAFDAINAGTHKGVIAVRIAGNTTEMAAATLNASGSGSSSYTYISIQPTGGAARTVSGTLTGALITLNAASHVNINGLNTGGNSLKFENTSAATTATAFTFTAAATYDTLTNCIFNGSAAFASTAGVITFTGTASSYIQISNCEIGPSGSNKPSAGIVSSSSGANNITVNNCNFHDINNTSGTNTNVTGGIILGYTYSIVYNSSWTITNNSFYYTSSLTANAGIIMGIYMYNNGYGMTVSNNYFGGTQPACGGTAMTITGTPYIVGFMWVDGHPSYGTMPNTGSNTFSGNVISNISVSSTNTSCPANSSGGSRFFACNLFGGNWVISGNTLGSMSSNDNIVLNDANQSWYHFYQIFGWIGTSSGPNVTSFANNNFGGITINTSNINTTVDYGIFPLYCWYSNTNYYSKLTSITNNTFGSSLANSIYAPNLGKTGAAGFVYLNSSDATVTCTGNTFQNMNVSAVGLYLFRNSRGITFSNNTIKNCSGPTNIYGVMAQGSDTYACTYSSNLVSNLTGSGSIYGIWTGDGPGASNPTVTISNNIVELGSGVSVNIPIYGIYGYYKFNTYFNTVYITGTGTSGTAASYAYYKDLNWYDAAVIKNNVFYNGRTNSGGTGTHYACYVGTTYGPNTIDYNDYFANGTGGRIGYYSGDITVLPNANLGSHSVNVNPLFASAGGGSALSYLPSASLVGVTGTGVTTDYMGVTRSTSIPAMGAMEYAKVWTGTVDGSWTNSSNWTPGVPATTDYITFSSTATNDLVLDQDRTVAGVNFNSSGHKVVLGTYNLTTGTCYNAGALSYLQTNGTGLVKATIPNAATYTFTAGNSAYNPLTITNNTGSSDLFSLNIVDAVYTDGTTGDPMTTPHINRTWHLTKQNANGGSGINMVFNWNAGENTGIITPNLYHYNGMRWVKQILGTSSNTSTSFTYNGYGGTFSPFTIADAALTLPVHLLSFTGKVTGSGNLLQWTATNETNGKEYELQRSTNGQVFLPVGTVAVRNNGGNTEAYQYTDVLPATGPNYYRLKETDLDGRSQYSNVVLLLNNRNSDAVTVYPNPASGKITVTDAGGLHNAVLRITDMSGHVLQQQTALNGNFTSADLSRLPGGIYVVQLINNNQTHQFLINKQ